MFENFPYSNFHDLNTDWLINRVKNVETSEANAKASEEAAAASERNAAFSDASAQTWTLQANNSAQKALEQARAAAQSAQDAEDTVENTNAQVQLLQSRVDNIIPSGTQTEGNTELIDIRVGYNGETYSGAGDAVRDQVNDIHNELLNKVNNFGTDEIESALIKGMHPLSVRTSENLFANATLIATGKYAAVINQNTGKVSLYDSPNLDTYIIKTDGFSIYTFTNCRTACLVKDQDLTAVGELLSYKNNINSSGAPYILFSFNRSTYPAENYSITKPLYKYEIPSNWIVDKEKKHTETVSCALTSSGSMTIQGRSALKDGESIIFKGYFESFIGFSLNFTTGTSKTNYIDVTATDIIIKNSTTAATTIQHGLNIQNEISLEILFKEGNAIINLCSMGNRYRQNVVWNQANGTVSQPEIKSNGTVFSNATLSIGYNSVSHKLWIFGDSYTGLTDINRWPYYLNEDGFLKNVLINGSAGSTSGGAMISFNTLLNYGLPKYAVFTTGMNDGSDSDTTPANIWVTNKNTFLQLCEENEITPIFATIPTIPSVNNEQKNTWIRSNGYRYIDFAKAVGADGTGSWYTGMLSSDNVHPTEKGAKALYSQLLIDLPEVTVS